LYCESRFKSTLVSKSFCDFCRNLWKTHRLALLGAVFPQVLGKHLKMIIGACLKLELWVLNRWFLLDSISLTNKLFSFANYADTYMKLQAFIHDLRLCIHILRYTAQSNMKSLVEKNRCTMIGHLIIGLFSNYL